MANIELVEDRLISGTGVLRIPEAVLKGRLWIIYVDVVRRPENEYQDFKWSPPQSLYARICYRRDGYVCDTDHIRYLREQRTHIPDITGQNLRAIKCAYEGILQTFFNLGNALALPSISITNLIKDYESLAFSYSEVVFKCYADTALQVRLFRLDYDVCNPENNRSRRPPPPPPPLPRIPPRTPIGNITPPYDDNDDDTQPYTGDETPSEEPTTQPCVAYSVTVRIFANWGDPQGTIGGYGYVDRTAEVWGEVFGLQFRKGIGAFVAIDCQGSTSNTCGERTNVVINSGVPDAGYPDPEILSITPV